jgi:hypothetical protein
MDSYFKTNLMLNNEFFPMPFPGQVANKSGGQQAIQITSQQNGTGRGNTGNVLYNNNNNMPTAVGTGANAEPSNGFLDQSRPGLYPNSKTPEYGVGNLKNLNGLGLNDSNLTGNGQKKVSADENSPKDRPNNGK